MNVSHKENNLIGVSKVKHQRSNKDGVGGLAPKTLPGPDHSAHTRRALIKSQRLRQHTDIKHTQPNPTCMQRSI